MARFNHLAFVSVFLTLLASSCCHDAGSGEARGSSLPAALRALTLREGDVVLRSGRGVTSAATRGFDPNHGKYSHIGILTRQAGRWVVVHAEPQDADSNDKTLRAETLEQFFAPDKASCGAIMRYRCDADDARKAARYAVRKQQQLTEFNSDYDWNDTTRLYCTQLVQLAYMSAGIDLAQNRQTTVSTRNLHGTFVFPSDIAKNDSLITIAQF